MLNTRHHPGAIDYISAYIGTLRESDLSAGLQSWVEAFQRALDDWRNDECQRLLREIKTGELTPEAVGLVRYVEGRWAEQRGDLTHAVGCYRASLAANTDEAHKWRRAQVLSDLALTYHPLGQLTEAGKMLAEALIYYRDSEDDEAILEVLAHLAGIYTDQGHLDQAWDCIQEGLTLAETDEDRAVLLAVQGAWHEAQGQTSLAVDCLCQSLGLYGKLGQVANRAQVLNNLGVLMLEAGDESRARAWLTEALLLNQTLGDWAGMAKTASNLALLAEIEGDMELALGYATQAIEDLDSLGDPQALGTALNLRGIIRADLQQWAEAAADFERSIRLVLQTGNHALLADIWNDMGTAYRHLGRDDDSASCYQQSLTIAQELGDQVRVARVTGNLGHLYAQQGDFVQAETCYRQAIALADKAKEHEIASGAMLGLCMLAFDRQDFQQLPELLEQAWLSGSEAGQIDVLVQANWLRGDLALLRGDQPCGLAAYLDAIELASTANAALLETTLERLDIHLEVLAPEAARDACERLSVMFMDRGVNESHPEVAIWLREKRTGGKFNND